MLVTLFKTKSGGVDKVLFKKYCNKLGVNLPPKLTNYFTHDQVSNLIYCLAVAIQDQLEKSSTKYRYLNQPIC